MRKIIPIIILGNIIFIIIASSSLAILLIIDNGSIDFNQKNISIEEKFTKTSIEIKNNTAYLKLPYEDRKIVNVAKNITKKSKNTKSISYLSSSMKLYSVGVHIFLIGIGIIMYLLGQKSKNTIKNT